MGAPVEEPASPPLRADPPSGERPPAGAGAGVAPECELPPAAGVEASPDQPPADPRARELARVKLAFRDVWRGLGRVRGRDTHLRPGELGLAQFELLSELYHRGELSVGELAGAARMAPGTVTQMLDNLAQSGHVERARPPHDRRVVVSRLTTLGREQLDAKRCSWEERWGRALEGLTAAQLAAAGEVLERLAAMIDEVARERSPQTPLEGDGEGRSEQPPGGSPAGVGEGREEVAKAAVQPRGS